MNYNLVRLYALHRAMKVNREKTPGVAIVDPYFMRDSQLVNPVTRASAMNYLQNFMVDNKSGKELILPFFPK